MRTVVALTFSLVLASAANAQNGTVYKIRDVCGWDMAQYCKGISFKRIRDLKECLAQHEKDLLPRCQDHYKEARAQ